MSTNDYKAMSTNNYKEKISDNREVEGLSEQTSGRNRWLLALAAAIIVCLVFIASLLGCSVAESRVTATGQAVEQQTVVQSDALDDRAVVAVEGSDASGFVMEDSSTITVEIDE